MNKVIEVSVLVTTNKRNILSLLDKKIDDVLLGKEIGKVSNIGNAIIFTIGDDRYSIKLTKINNEITEL